MHTMNTGMNTNITILKLKKEKGYKCGQHFCNLLSAPICLLIQHSNRSAPPTVRFLPSLTLETTLWNHDTLLLGGSSSLQEGRPQWPFLFTKERKVTTHFIPEGQLSDSPGVNFTCEPVHQNNFHQVSKTLHFGVHDL